MCVCVCKVDVVEEGEDNACIEPSQLASPTYEELLEVMAHATTRFDER